MLLVVIDNLVYKAIRFPGGIDMTAEEFYAMIEGNYALIQGRKWDDTKVKRFVKLFLMDESYTQLQAALEAGDVEAAFNAAHTLKGVCANIAFAKLQASASAVTEALRAKNLELAIELNPQVKEDYAQHMKFIKLFVEE